MFRNLIFGAAIVVASMTAAKAAPVSYYFSADLTLTRGDAQSIVGFALPDVLTGEFLFDDAAAPSTMQSFPNGNSVTYFPITVNANLGSATYTSTLGSFRVTDGIDATSQDSFQASGGGAFVRPAVGSGFADFSLTFFGLVHTRFSGTSVPTISELQSMANLHPSNRILFSVFDDQTAPTENATGFYNNIQFSATPFAPAVPLPSAVWFLASGLGVIGVARRRRLSR